MRFCLFGHVIRYFQLHFDSHFYLIISFCSISVWARMNVTKMYYEDECYYHISLSKNISIKLFIRLDLIFPFFDYFEIPRETMMFELIVFMRVFWLLIIKTGQWKMFILLTFFRYYTTTSVKTVAFILSRIPWILLFSVTRVWIVITLLSIMCINVYD